MRYFLLIICSFISAISFSQKNEARIYRIHSSHTSFPDTARANGHVYNKVLYDAASHYQDSSVLIIVPPGFKAGNKIDLIFWFHGWLNNIDSAAQYFALIKQLVYSGQNAILVLAETTKNAPDSYGGKLEYDNTFKDLVTDVFGELKKQKSISKKAETGKIILAGHSGAYRVMSFILQNGGLPVQEVILFDALYGQTDKFMNWLTADKSHRFINIYTDGGGTVDETKGMEKQLISLNYKPIIIEESALTPDLLSTEDIIFIHSAHLHNDIIRNPDNFQFFLENIPFLKKVKQ